MSNIDNVVQQYTASIEQWAFAYARGKDAFTDMAMRLFTDVRTSDMPTEGLAGYVYDRVRLRAEAIAVDANKPLSPQSTKSRASQASKLNGFVQLGVIARDHEEVVQAMEYARGKERAAGRYTKMVACVVAMKACIARDIANASDLGELCNAVDDALDVKPALASEDLEAARKALEDVFVAHKSAIVAALALENLPADYMPSIDTRLAKVIAVVKRAELANVPA